MITTKNLLCCLLIISTVSFSSCGPSKKEKRIEELKEMRREAQQNLRESENDLNKTDNNEIDERSSFLVGHPVTKGQVRRGAVENAAQSLRSINDEINTLENY